MYGKKKTVRGTVKHMHLRMAGTTTANVAADEVIMCNIPHETTPRRVRNKLAGSTIEAERRPNISSTQKEIMCACFPRRGPKRSPSPMPRLGNSCGGYCYRFQRHRDNHRFLCCGLLPLPCPMISLSLQLNKPAYQKCKRTPWHVEMRTAKSLSFITECACGYNKAKK